MKKSGLQYGFGLWLAAQADHHEVVICLLDSGLAENTTDTLEIAGSNTKRAMNARLEYSSVYEIKERVTGALDWAGRKASALIGTL
jgi:hypothetical protein